MKHAPAFALAIGLVALFAGCKRTAADNIIGKWQEIRIENPALDQTVAEQRQFIDTVGQSTDAAQNLALYGTASIDSFKTQLRAGVDSFLGAQRRAIEASWFLFRKDGVVVTHSETGLDSASWSIDEDGGLVFDEEALKGSGQKLRFEIGPFNDTALRLKYTEAYLSSTAIFRRLKK